MRLRRPGPAAARRAFEREVTSCGRGLSLVGRALIDNRGAIHVGDDVEIASCPVVSHLATGPHGVLVIADGVRIGSGAALSSLGRVTIEDGARLGSMVMIMDSDFHVAGDRDAMSPPAPVLIGRGATLGHRVVVLPGSTIGAGAVVTAGSVVSGAVGAGELVSGNPAVAGDLADGAGHASVGHVVAHLFGLTAPATGEMGPDDIEGWDSLGALRLLLALESAFGVVLDDRDLEAVHDVASLTRLVDAARTRAAAPR